MKSNTPIKLERLIRLAGIFRQQATRRPTASSLGKELEVTERTIRHDIAFLRDRYHAPIEYTKTKGWHYTDLNWNLPTIPLGEGELFALILGARMLESYAGAAYSNQLRSAIQRLGERLPETTWVNLQQVASDRVLFRTGAKIDLDPQIWQSLETACQMGYSTQMTYYTASRDSVGERIFDPYLLHIYRSTNPYVIGYCHTRQAIRWFRVDRIRKLEVLAQSFSRDPNFDAQQHFEDIFQAEVGGELQSIEIWFDGKTAPYIRERIWHPSQEIIEHGDGAMTLKFVAKGLQELRRWVLSYGRGAIVLQPPELVVMMGEEIEGMKSGY
ncbi:MAG: transcriptional regulator [Chamaesiphon sp.]|nr:transcriptional regulator [Chamaesiphon sp.]